jgi:hypothetical protein
MQTKSNRFIHFLLTLTLFTRKKREQSRSGKTNDITPIPEGAIKYYEHSKMINVKSQVSQTKQIKRLLC